MPNFPLPLAWIELLLPDGCRLCGAAAVHREPWPLCRDHALDLKRRSRCRTCAAALPQGLPDRSSCARCRRRHPGVARTVCIGDYRGGLREHVLRAKHGGRRDLAVLLGHALGGRLREELGAPLREEQDPRIQARPVVLVPVPLHRLRRFQRGYDQALELARGVAASTGWPIERRLARGRASAPQGSLAVGSREANVAGSFAPRGSGCDARALYVVVDDVATSMATARHAAVALRRSGAGQVVLATAARAARGVPGRADP